MKTVWGEQLNPDSVLQEYPRPQLMRESYENLNGLWDYAITKTDAKPDAWDGKILVPFSPEAELSGVGKALQPGQFLWYRRTLTLPEIPAGHRLLLHIGACDQRAKVFCNGQYVMEHVGGYTAFSSDLTAFVHAGDNELTVQARDDREASQLSRGKQSSRRGGIWYTPQSGIWQTVWYEWVPENYVKAIRYTPDLITNQLLYQILAPAPAGAVVRLSLHGQPVAESAADEKGFGALAIPAETLRLWSPESPTLYDVDVTLGEDRVTSYAAMRSFGVGEDEDGTPRLLLNGKPYYQNGVLDQGYWPDGLYTAPSDEAMIFDLQLMKDMGFNMLRKHIKIESARWYYHCDRLGMLVWQDAVSGGGTDGEYNAWTTNRKPTLIRSTWNKFRDDTAKHFTALGADDPIYRRDWSRTCDAMVHMLGGHPSIVTWTLFNEGWGQFDACDAAERIHALDPTRPIDATSGWYDQHCGDFHSVHNYFRPLEIYPDKGPLRGYVAEFEKKHRRRRRAAHYVVLPVARHGVRAFVISEFGGLAQLVPEHAAVSRAYGYGEYDSIDDWRAAVRSVLASAAALESRGLAGYVYTQVSDVEEELNGLLTYDRRVDKFAE